SNKRCCHYCGALGYIEKITAIGQQYSMMSGDHKTSTPQVYIPTKLHFSTNFFYRGIYIPV
ncbi:hypothetical protein QIG29_27380, partial [Klebsiella pneumoniae]|nr:hypothetical protein [Klebsiella pneumoniae]